MSTLGERLAAIRDASDCEVADLNDWAVNTLRESAASHDRWPPRSLRFLLCEEEARLLREQIGSLRCYLKCRRVGSRWRLSRAERRAVYVAIITRAEFQRRTRQ